MERCLAFSVKELRNLVLGFKKDEEAIGQAMTQSWSRIGCLQFEAGWRVECRVSGVGCQGEREGGVEGRCKALPMRTWPMLHGGKCHAPGRVARREAGTTHV